MQTKNKSTQAIGKGYWLIWEGVILELDVEATVEGVIRIVVPIKQ